MEKNNNLKKNNNNNIRIYPNPNTNKNLTEIKAPTTSNNNKYNYNNNYIKETKAIKEEKYKQSYSQDKSYFNHTLRTVTDITTKLPYIRPLSPSYPSYYKSSLKKSDNEKISYLTECLKEKEEELNLLNKCLEEKENELKEYKNKNNKINII